MRRLLADALPEQCVGPVAACPDAVARDPGIDLLFASRAAADLAAAVLVRHGYQPEPDPGKFFFERKGKLLKSQSGRVHSSCWRAPNPESVAKWFDVYDTMIFLAGGVSGHLMTQGEEATPNRRLDPRRGRPC